MRRAATGTGGVLVLTLCALLTFGGRADGAEQHAGPRDLRSSLRAARVAELRRIGEALRVAVIAKDFEALLKYDRRNTELKEPEPEDGFADGYGYYEADRLLLQSRTSWLYCRHTVPPRIGQRI